MESKLKKELDELEKIITSKDYPKNINSISYWVGADVIISPERLKKSLNG